MAKEKLTAKNIATLPEGIYNLERGVYLRVKGQYRSWLFKYSFNGKRCEIGLGGIDQSIAGVRAKALKLKSILSEGKDPRVEMRQQKTIKALEIAVQESAEAPTFDEMLSDAVAHYEKIRGWLPCVAKDYENVGRKVGSPVFGHKPVDQITPCDLAAAIEPVWSKPSGRRTQYKLRTIFQYAILKGWIDSNPAEWRDCLDLHLPRPELALRGQQQRHRAAVSANELKLIAQKISKTDTIMAKCVLFGLLTVCRSQEFRAAKWSEIDWEKETLSVPPSRRKDKKSEPFIVPLSKQALEVLKSVPRTPSDYIFTFLNDQPLGVLATLSVLKKSTKQPITMHGTRSTFSDWCAQNDKPFIVSEKCLMHSVGNKVFMAYQRDDLLEKRRKLLQEWADFLMPISSNANIAEKSKKSTTPL